MATTIKLNEAGNVTEVTVLEDVKKVTARINLARKQDHPFVDFTGPDGKAFAVTAALVEDIREA